MLATPLAAQTDLPDAIRSAEARQTQLRQQAAQVAAGLQTIIDEYRRNGLAGEDLKVLEAVRDVLGNLSARQMAQVIESLQQARAAGDTPAGRQALVGAVAGQKDIVVRLRQVLAEYQRRQALVELAQRLSALAQRQDANLRQVVELGRVLGGKTDLKDDQRISLSLQQAEQQAIRDEVLPLLARLAVTRSEAGAEVRQRLDAALAHATDSRLRALLDSALDALRQPALYRAAAEEKSIRDALRELSRLVMPPLDEATALRQALTDLDGLIARQNQLLADTRQPTARDQAAALEQSQARIVDEVDQARRDLATLAPQASATLASATTPMQEARAELQSKRPEPAAEKQVAALGVLQSAREQVARQLARAEQNPAAAPDRLAAARDAREQVKQLLEDQRQLGQDTAAERRADALPAMGTRQDALEQRARQALEQAGATSPPAAADLADAAGQMDRAAEALTKRQRQPAQDAQTAAVAALRRAEEQLARETRQLQQAQADLARANDARQQVADLLQEQRAMELDTNRRAQQPGTPTPPQAAADQRDLAARTAEVERRVPAAQQDAVAALDAARQRMDQAAADLAADRPDRAAQAQRQAAENLARSLAALDERAAQLGQQLGRPQTPDPQALDATRRQVEELQQTVTNAQRQLAGQAPAALQDLQRRQNDIAQALEQQSPAPGAPPSSPQTAQAREAARQAAADLNRGDLPRAIEQMQQAAGNLDQATRAAAQAGQPGRSGAEPGVPNGQPSAGPGQQPGSPSDNRSGQPSAAPSGQPSAVPGQAAASALAQLASQQADLLREAQARAGQGVPAAPPEALAQAARQAGTLGAGPPAAVPPAAAAALGQAAQALSDSAAAAASANTPGAQSAAAAAQQSLGQAATSLAMAQAGMPGGARGQPGPRGAGQSARGGTGDRNDTAAVPDSPGPRRDESGTSNLINLPPRDRAAILQSQNDRYPQEYAPQIEQYLRNLADPRP